MKFFKKILIYSTALIFFIGCGGSSIPTETSTIENIDIPIDENSSLPSVSLPQMQIYFSKTEGDFTGGTDEIIIEDINNTHNSILLAMYDFTNTKIANALLAAKERGVSIEIITDDSKISDEIYLQLKDANITVYHDNNPDALMHDKFLVLDSDIVWMGSANFTYYAFYRNNENSIRWNNTKIASYYTEEFQELITDMPVKKIYEEKNVFLYFSPEDDFRSRLVALINHASTHIDFMIYTFTDHEISDALLAAQDRGVSIKGIFDEDQNTYQTYSKYTILLENGINVKLDGNPYKLHHKVMIIDSNTTIVGSYNFTDAANSKNSEDSMVIYDINVSSHFQEEFDRLFSLAH